MRMWMIDPVLMCNKHLIGEHGEIHKHRHVFVKGHSISGRAGQIEPRSMKSRHDELVAEMINRKMNHKSPYELPELNEEAMSMSVDREESLCLLASRCINCRLRMQEK